MRSDTPNGRTPLCNTSTPSGSNPDQGLDLPALRRLLHDLRYLLR